MTDIFSLLMNAQVFDSNGDECNDIVALHYIGGKLILIIRANDEDDDDDPDREDVPQPTINEKIRAIAGKKAG